MIAVCPACHDAVHHGRLRISDEDLYLWKQIQRPAGPIKAYLYVEPANRPKIMLGSIAIQTDHAVVVFNFSHRNLLSMEVRDEQILHLSVSVITINGEEVLRITDGHITHEPRPDVDLQLAPGRLTVTVPASPDFFPNWFFQHPDVINSGLMSGATVTALSVKVLKPGLVRLEGVWIGEGGAVLINDTTLYLSGGGDPPRFVRMVGDGENSVFRWNGPIDGSMFFFGTREQIS